MYTSVLERACSGIEKETSHVTVVCAHHDVPAFAETSITPYPSFLTERFSFTCGNSLHSDWQVHTTYCYRKIQGRELGRKKTSRVVTLCVRRVLPRTRSPHFSPHFPIHECTQPAGQSEIRGPSSSAHVP